MGTYSSKYASGAAIDTQLDLASTHATRHKSGGGDSIKLDELAAPTDTTALNASTTTHGLLRKLSNVATQYLDAQGNWTTPPGTWASNFATTSTAGKICEANDPRLSSAPAHALNHRSTGTDPLTVTTLAGFTGAGTAYLDDSGNFSVPTASGSVFKPAIYVGKVAGCNFICNGSNDTSQIQAAINAAAAAGGGDIYILQGNYAISSLISLKDKVSLFGIGQVTLTSSISSGNMFETGTSNYSSTTTNLTSSAAAGDVTLQVTSTGYAAGDWIKIIGAADTDGFVAGEVVRIISTGSGTITVDRPLYAAYTTSNSAKIRKITMFQNIKIENLNFIGVGVETESKCLSIFAGYNILINRCTFKNFGTQCLELIDCLESSVTECIFKNIFYTGFGYSIVLGNDCDNFIIDRCNFKEKGRHYIAHGAATSTAVAGGYLRHLKVTNCNFEHSTEEAINTHEPARGWITVANCKFYECGKGVEFYNSVSNLITNCYFYNSDPSPASNPITTYQTFLNSGKTLVEGCYFENYYKHDLRTDCTFIGNQFRGAGYIYCGGSDAIKLIVKNNEFTELSGYGVGLAGGEITLDVTGNTFSAASATTPVIYLENVTADVTIQNNNIPAGLIELYSAGRTRLINNIINGDGYTVRVSSSSGQVDILNNHITSTSRGISLEGTGTGITANIKRNYISGTVSNTGGYTVVDDNVRV